VVAGAALNPASDRLTAAQQAYAQKRRDGANM
jgi:hypothetical protein